MTILGLDIGEKRTGVAISNNVSSICTPLEYINSNNNFLEQISKIISEKNIDTIIIGLPKLLSGKEGKRAKISRKISKEIQSEYNSIKVILWDERLTTEQAFKSMKSAGMKIKNIKSKLNSVSAIIILESYLQNQNAK